MPPEVAEMLAEQGHSIDSAIDNESVEATVN
jgi:hypothetical protein